MSRSKKRSHTYLPPTPEVITLFPRNENQEIMMELIREKPITIANGASGVGKSCIALHEAVHLMQKREIDKILYIKPNVDFGKYERGIGFLKGEMDEKLLPLLYPVIDNLSVFCTPGKAQYMLDKKQIEIGLLEYLRGRSLRRTFVLVDEVQNTTPHALLTVITRLGEGSKLVAIGDTMQCDIGLQNNALEDALTRLKGIPEVGIVEFSAADIVRNTYLHKIIHRYRTGNHLRVA